MAQDLQRAMILHTFGVQVESLLQMSANKLDSAGGVEETFARTWHGFSGVQMHASQCYPPLCR